MRCVAGAGLFVLVGCNQVFGIGNTEPYDAPIDDPELAHVKLTWQVADVLPSGRPDPAIADVEIQPAPRVRYAALDLPFEDAGYGVGGSIALPRALFEPADARPTWRFEYTLADNLPHEVQWSPEDQRGQIAIPRFGRIDRLPVPDGSGYQLAPVGAPSFKGPRVFTTGLWTEARALNHPGATIDFDFFGAAPMSGARGKPDRDHGDRAVVVDYDTDPQGCRFAIGAADFDPTLVANARSTPPAVWDALRPAVSSDGISGELLSRFGAGFGAGVTDGTIQLGIAASASMPGLTGVPPSGGLPISTALPTPVMITVLECPYDPLTPRPVLPNAAQPTILGAYPRLLHVQLVTTRRVDGITLNSGMETAILSDTSTGFHVTFPAAIPTAITLETAAGPVDLIAGPEGVGIGAAAGRFTLAFVPETGAGLRADHHDVTLYRLDAGSLVPIRVYTATQPRVVIDGAVLSAPATYVFEIRSFKGHPGAPQGDFRTVDYPYGTAIRFTRTFRTS